ncbi:MAG TPA: cation:proton antiporter subunit C [Bacillota bacterium]|nr:cation:proton antiporter subunit C [Bacillota bacterium]
MISVELFLRLNYLAGIMLFLIGLHTMLTHANLIKKVMGMNIMETGIFLFMVSIGYAHGTLSPIIRRGGPVQGLTYTNPLLAATVLTGIVIAVSTTAYALSLIVKLYEQCGTLDVDRLEKLRS